MCTESKTCCQYIVSALSLSVCVCVQLPQAQQGQTGPASSQPNLLHMPHRQSPLHQASSSSSTSSSSSALSVGQLVSSKCPTQLSSQHFIMWFITRGITQLAERSHGNIFLSFNTAEVEGCRSLKEQCVVIIPGVSFHITLRISPIVRDVFISSWGMLLFSWRIKVTTFRVLVHISALCDKGLYKSLYQMLCVVALHYCIILYLQSLFIIGLFNFFAQYKSIYKEIKVEIIYLDVDRI